MLRLIYKCNKSRLSVMKLQHKKELVWYKSCWLRLRNVVHLFYFLEEDISEEEEVKTNETGSISQKRSHSEVCQIITIEILTDWRIFRNCVLDIYKINVQIKKQWHMLIII